MKKTLLLLLLTASSQLTYANEPLSASETIKRSIHDLSERLSIEENTVEVVEAIHVIWPDTSAGCAKPGYNYAQMLTNGFLVRLKVEDKIFQYHGGSVGPALYCETPSSKPIPRYQEM